MGILRNMKSYARATITFTLNFPASFRTPRAAFRRSRLPKFFHLERHCGSVAAHHTHPCPDHKKQFAGSWGDNLLPSSTYSAPSPEPSAVEQPESTRV